MTLVDSILVPPGGITPVSGLIWFYLVLYLLYQLITRLERLINDTGLQGPVDGLDYGYDGPSEGYNVWRDAWDEGDATTYHNWRANHQKQHPEQWSGDQYIYEEE